MKKKHKVYICGTDAAYHIPDDRGGVNIYFSPESAKENTKCWEECGIVELVLDCSKPKTIIESNWDLALKNAKTGNQIAWEEIYKCPYNITKDVKKHLSNLIWGVRSLITAAYYNIYYRIKDGKR